MKSTVYFPPVDGTLKMNKKFILREKDPYDLKNSQYGRKKTHDYNIITAIVPDKVERPSKDREEIRNFYIFEAGML
jgi:hypothetical protein